jgi:hypothetical protein
MNDPALFPMTASEVMAKARVVLVRAVDGAAKAIERAEARHEKARAALDDFDLGLEMAEREHQQALAELRRDLALGRGADLDTGA